MIGEMSVVPRVAKPFRSSLLESYWPEVEHLSNGLGSAVSFKIPASRYVADLNELFALARGWVIAHSVMATSANGMRSQAGSADLGEMGSVAGSRNEHTS